MLSTYSVSDMIVTRGSRRRELATGGRIEDRLCGKAVLLVHDSAT
jgi:hypothetical protein